jgi:hypothetical protein
MIRRLRRSAAFLALVALAACAKPTVQQAATPGPSPSSGGAVGYVNMQELVKAHPLYSQLAQTERSIGALSLSSLGPGVAQTGANLSKEDAELQKELTQASEETKKILDQKAAEYQREENAAIAAALAAGGHAVAAGPVGANVGATARQQAAGVQAEMSRNLSAYEKTLSRQEMQQTAAYERAVSQRADRQYAAKARELQSKESELALQLATKDAPQRLELRTRLANLALDNTAREQVRSQLDALDKSEADQVAAMHNRDQQTLAQLRTQLRAQAQREVETGVAKIHAQNEAKVVSRAGSATVPTVPGGGIVVPPNIPPDLKTKIDALHKEYQDRYTRDAKATIDKFNQTRDDLKKRYDELHGVDAASSASLSKELAGLQEQHDKLYSQIVDQINREVRIVAQRQGITTVFTEIAGKGTGTDLTPAVKKEIESLHE